MIDTQVYQLLLQKNWRVYSLASHRGTELFVWDPNTDCMLKMSKDILENIVHSNISSLRDLKKSSTSSAK